MTLFRTILTAMAGTLGVPVAGALAAHGMASERSRYGVIIDIRCCAEPGRVQLRWLGHLETAAVLTMLLATARQALPPGAGAAICALITALRPTLRIDPDFPFERVALELTSDTAADAWAQLRTIAEAQDAPIPDDIILGIEPTFYATSTPIRLPAKEERILEGDTLYLPPRSCGC